MEYRELASDNERQFETSPPPPPARHPFRAACELAVQQDKVLSDLLEQRRAGPGETLPDHRLPSTPDGECPEGMTVDNYEQQTEERWQEMDALTDPVELDSDIQPSALQPGTLMM
jgi:hypothetical protein